MSKCEHCDGDITPGNFITLNGGALLMTGRDYLTLTGGPDNQLDGFLNLFYHDDSTSTYCSEVIREHGTDGQFELYFCSKECTSKWFSSKVDKLAPGIDLNK